MSIGIENSVSRIKANTNDSQKKLKAITPTVINSICTYKGMVKTDTIITMLNNIRNKIF